MLLLLASSSLPLQKLSHIAPVAAAAAADADVSDDFVVAAAAAASAAAADYCVVAAAAAAADASDTIDVRPTDGKQKKCWQKPNAVRSQMKAVRMPNLRLHSQYPTRRTTPRHHVAS